MFVEAGTAKVIDSLFTSLSNAEGKTWIRIAVKKRLPHLPDKVTDEIRAAFETHTVSPPTETTRRITLKGLLSGLEGVNSQTDELEIVILTAKR